MNREIGIDAALSRYIYELGEVDYLECPECGGEGKIGVFVTDPRDEAECSVCDGKGEVAKVAHDERENGPRY